MSIKDFREKYGNYNGLELDFNLMNNALCKGNIKIISNNCHGQLYTKKERVEVLTHRELYEKIKTPGSIDHTHKFWSRKFEKFDADYWNIPYKCTKESRLKILQWKILHNIYPTNILLYKMKIAGSIQCKYCNEVDFTEHFFAQCKLVRPIWQEIENMIAVRTDKRMKLGIKEIMLGITIGKGLNEKDNRWVKWSYLK